MAEVTVEVEVPAKTETRVSHYICDLCGSKSDSNKSWGNGRYDTEKPTVNYKNGSDFPEGGSGEYLIFDICPDCFMNKLVPWFKSQGAEPRIDGYDW